MSFFPVELWEPFFQLVRWSSPFIVPAVIGAGIVGFQLRKQFELNRKLKAEEQKQALFIELYREVDVLIRNARSEYVLISTPLHQIAPYFSYKLENPEDEAVLSIKSNDVLPHYEAYTASVIKVLLKIESLEIIHKNIFIFRYAFGSGLYDLGQMLFPFMRIACSYFPTQPPNHDLATEEVHQPGLPSRDQLQNIVEVTQQYTYACTLLDSWMHDLHIELQNFLLGGLFDHRVPKRHPIDQRYKVIAIDSSDTVDELRNYFDNETEWGRNNQRIDGEVRAALNE